MGEFISELIDSVTEDDKATLRLDGIPTREGAELMTLPPRIPNTVLKQLLTCLLVRVSYSTKMIKQQKPRLL